MSALTGTSNQAAVTPYRRTRNRFDITEVVAIEPAFAATRYGTQIAQGKPPLGLQSSNVQQLANGSWAVLPVQELRTIIAEHAPSETGILQLSQWTAIPSLVERNSWKRSTDLSGVTYGADVAASANPFIMPAPSQSQGWGGTLSTDIGVVPQPLEFDAPPERTMSRAMVLKAEAQANHGLFIRFITMGKGTQTSDLELRVYFGGPAAANEMGQSIAGHFCLSLMGNGTALLFEQVAGAWTMRHTFVWAEKDQIGGTQHSIRILPFVAPGGKSGGIEFRTRVEHRATATVAASLLSAPRGASQPSAHISQYRVAFPHSQARTKMTGMGKVRVDLPTDQRTHVQISTLRYPTEAILYDTLISLDFYASNPSELIMQWRSTCPTGTSVEGQLLHPETGAELAIISSDPGNNRKTYEYPAGVWQVFPKFILNSSADGTRCPTVDGVTVQRDGVLATNDQVSEVSASAVRYSITGPERDPTHETAAVTLQDVTNNLSLLRKRAFIPVQIETEYDPIDPELKSVLFRGYAARVDSTKRGTAGMVYPSAEWRRYDATYVGMWARLKQAITFVSFDASSAPDNPDLAYKVTDLIRVALTWAGFTGDQVYVEDHPIRLQSSIDKTERNFYIWPGQSVFELVTQLLHDYLGWPLIWDGNAGTDGMWIVRAMKQAPLTPLASFSTAGPGVSGRLPHRPESYGTENWVGSFVSTFIKRGTFKTFAKPPEANLLVVSTTGDLNETGEEAMKNTCWVVNPKSYNFFRNSDGSRRITADPESIDYLPMVVALVVIDPSLAVGPDSAYNLQWVTRRYFDLACHGTKMAVFEAPLVLVNDEDDVNQTRPRPLRFGDPVYVNGYVYQCRNCNPTYRKDDVQMAIYECETSEAILGPATLGYDSFTRSEPGTLLDDHPGEQQNWTAFTGSACLALNAANRLYVS